MSGPSGPHVRAVRPPGHMPGPSGLKSAWAVRCAGQPGHVSWTATCPGCPGHVWVVWASILGVRVGGTKMTVFWGTKMTLRARARALLARSLSGQLPAAPPWTAHSTSASPRLLGRGCARLAGLSRRAAPQDDAQATSRTRSSVHHSHIRASTRTECPLGRARGKWFACAAPPHATWPHPEKARRHAGCHPDAAATPARHRNRWILPAASPRKSQGAYGGHLQRTPGAVVCASHCWGTTCPSGPTA